jgi:hypothetical protein
VEVAAAARPAGRSVAVAVSALLRIRLRRVIPDMRISRLSGWHDGAGGARIWLIGELFRPAKSMFEHFL